MPHIGECIIHSANPVGSENLLRSLRQYYKVRRENPFNYKHTVPATITHHGTGMPLPYTLDTGEFNE